MQTNNEINKRVVVKLGTNLITSDSIGINRGLLESLVNQIAKVRSNGTQLLIVTSGAVGAGREVIKKIGTSRNFGHKSIVQKQALAAVGQTQLMLTYEHFFAKHNISVAQALISRGDLINRVGYLNARNTLESLLEIGIVPIINENDVVAVEELEGIVYGDNDRLSAMVANAVDADLLILLGEVDGLYTSDPHDNPDAVLVKTVDEITIEMEEQARGSHDGIGSGGMISKLQAAKLATSSGISMVIASGSKENIVERVCRGDAIGTRFTARLSKIEARKRWIITGITENHGSLTIDKGAENALKQSGVSLLPAGVIEVHGIFNRGDIIEIKNDIGKTLAWGIANYPSEDLLVIKGRKTNEVQVLLGHYYGDETIHRNNMALT